MNEPLEVDLVVDLNTMDETGLPWAFLDAAAHPERIVPGDYVIAGSGVARWAESAGRIAGAVFAEHAIRNRLPSIAWGVVHRGHVVASGGTGVDAVYRIASMTKSFTAAAVLSLRDEGLLRLDDPITTYAPEWASVVGPTRDSPPITMRHLLTMSSGLATDDPWADRHLDASDDELDRFVANGATFAAAPGTEFEYSNLGYGLIGRVVQRVTGLRLQDVVTQRLLVPLGLSSTTWVAGPTARSGWHRYEGDGLSDPSNGDDGLVGVPHLGDGTIAPMGGLFSTVADLARWIGFFTDAYPPRDDPDDAPLSRASRREMQQAWRAYPDAVGGYGMGLNVLGHPTLGTVVTHSGGVPGFGSNMRWLPHQGVGLVALADLTYARMATATTDALEALAAAGIVGPVRVPVSPAALAAATALVTLHESWDHTIAARLFADNVDPDEPLERRRVAAAALREAHGPFRLARVAARSATSAEAVVHGREVEVRIDFQLTPTLPPLVQHYEATVVTT